MACRMLVPQPGIEPKLSSESTESHLVDHQGIPSYCILYCHSLTGKKVIVLLKNVLDETVKVINFTW